MADEHLREGREAEAAELYVYLWNHMLELEPGYVGVRDSFFISTLRRASGKSAIVRDAITEQRDSIYAGMNVTRPSSEDLRDWVALNGALDEEERTLAWFDEIKGQRNARRIAEGLGWHRLHEMLARNDRWEDYGAMISSPLGRMREEHSFLQLVLEHGDPDYNWRGFREKAGAIYAAMLAAERIRDAMNAVDAALRYDDSAAMRMALVRVAVRAGQYHARHETLLEEAAARTSDPKELEKIELLWELLAALQEAG